MVALLSLLAFPIVHEEARARCSGVSLGDEVAVPLDGWVEVEVRGCATSVVLECPWEAVVDTPPRSFLRDGDIVAFALVPGAADATWSASCRITSRQGTSTLELFAAP